MNADFLSVRGAASDEAVLNAAATITLPGRLDPLGETDQPGVLDFAAVHPDRETQRAYIRAVFDQLVATTEWELLAIDGDTEATIGIRS